MTPHSAMDYLTERGIQGPEALNAALRRVLDAMEPMVYEEPASGLTAAEQAVLKAGGLHLDRIPERDPVAEGAVKFAAIVERSLTAEEVAARLGITATRIRQLIASRELYSFRLGGKRLVPDFQIRSGKLVPNINEVNRVLPETMHPLGVYNWFHLPNVDLFADDDMETLVSPLDWLALGRDPALIVTLAERL